MFKKGFKLTLLLVTIFGIVAGAVYTLDFLGVINFNKMAAQVPVVGQYFKEEDKAKSGTKTQTKEEQLKILMENNQQLADRNTLLNSEVEDLKRKFDQANLDKNNLLIKYNEDLAKVKAENDPKALAVEEEKYKQLAKYYGSMKADAAVKILNEMETSMVIEILNRVEADQTAKILSKMDPKKAAEITKEMTN
jgi:flagellar protein FlbB